MKILIADDDPQILRTLRITLTAYGYEVVTAGDGATALRKTSEHHPDLVMLDLGMPRLNGIEVIEGIRGWSPVPILVVSGRSESTNKVQALDVGADDYVTKPFSLEELLARIRALTRRTTAMLKETTIAFADVSVDLSAKHIKRASNGDTIRLTPTEWNIVEILLKNQGRLITRQSLLAEVWGPQHNDNAAYLRIYMGQIRKKLELDPSTPQHFITEPGMGYRFMPDNV